MLVLTIHVWIFGRYDFIFRENSNGLVESLCPRGVFMNFLRVIPVAAAFFASSAFAQNVLNNGDMEYGDGGWYLWNNPDGPAVVESQIAVENLGVDGSNGAKVIVKEVPKIWWGLQLQPPKFLADSAYYTLSFKAKGNMPINAVVQGGPPDYRQKESGSFQLRINGKHTRSSSLPTRKVMDLTILPSRLVCKRAGSKWMMSKSKRLRTWIPSGTTMPMHA